MIYREELKDAPRDMTGRSCGEAVIDLDYLINKLEVIARREAELDMAEGKVRVVKVDGFGRASQRAYETEDEVIESALKYERERARKAIKRSSDAMESYMMARKIMTPRQLKRLDRKIKNDN